MKRIIMPLLLLGCLLVPAQAANLAGKYYRCQTVNGVRKVHRDEWIDFRSGGRCIDRSRLNRASQKRYRTEIASYEIVGDFVQVAGDDGVFTFEIAGDRLVSEDGAYIRASVADKPAAPKKVARKK